MKQSTIISLFIFLAFMQWSCRKDLPEVIKVTTLEPTDIMATTVNMHGEIIDAGLGITAYGHCWALHSSPEVKDFTSNHGRENKTKKFLSEIEDLEPGERYYFRSYAKRNDEIHYGDILNFTTGDGKAALTTSEITGITSSSAQSGGNITSAGGSEVLSRGVCWNTEGNPTIDNSKTEDGSGMGSFTSILTGLDRDTEYYVRAWAQTAFGISYGEQLSFKTTTMPAVTTSAVTSITSNSAMGGGNVTSSGGATVTARGIAYGTSQTPTISGNTVSSGSGTGSFTATITGLQPGMTYYVRAYATNNVGTSYGEQVSFTTGAVIPTVTTSSITNITSNSATGGGNVTSSGGATVTARGIAYGTSQTPTISGNTVSAGSGTGSFTATITGLQPGMTYYVRAYATNNAGTSYGEQVSFTTIVLGENDVFNPATGRVWMDRNMGATRAATSSTDTYGYYYQWGRAADGHQIRTSSTTSTLSNSDTPGHGNFIRPPNSPYDWRSPQNQNLWQGVNGVNNPCPPGYRLPTQAEWQAERQSWSSDDAAGAFASPLKLPVAGFRGGSNGSLSYVGSIGSYWSSTVDGTYSRGLFFGSSDAYMFSSSRADGSSVRCLKD